MWAFTRAMQSLALTFAVSRMLYNQRRNNPPSRFLSEIPERLIEDDRARREPVRVPPPRAGYAPVSPAARGNAGAKRAPLRARRYSGRDQGFLAALCARGAGAGAQALFSPGDRVTHKVFGAGTVLESRSGQEFASRFDTRGERTFPASHRAEFENIEGCIHG